MLAYEGWVYFVCYCSFSWWACYVWAYYSSALELDYELVHVYFQIVFLADFLDCFWCDFHHCALACRVFYLFYDSLEDIQHFVRFGLSYFL